MFGKRKQQKDLQEMMAKATVALGAALEDANKKPSFTFLTAQETQDELAKEILNLTVGETLILQEDRYRWPEIGGEVVVAELIPAGKRSRNPAGFVEDFAAFYKDDKGCIRRQTLSSKYFVRKTA